MVRGLPGSLCLALALLAGCATTPPTRPLPAAQARCMQAYIDDDARLARAGIHDAQAMRVAGHPYLRVDRLLASFTDELHGRAQRAAWLARASALDSEGRAIEHARLPRRLDNTDAQMLAACRDTLSQALLGDDAAWPALRTAAEVPDDYSTTRRALGLYALSSRLVLQGVARLQRREMPRPLDARAADALVVERYQLGSAAQATVPKPSWTHDALGIPELDADLLAALLRQHAPALAIETAGDDDIPGHIHRRDPPYVHSAHTTLYTQLAHTRLGTQVLPQLVYTWWFTARSAQGVIDPLAGKLDGLSWRVTLDSDGDVLAYDVVHNCGCYHMFFPTQRLQTRKHQADDAEPPWIPFTVPPAWQGRVRVVLEKGSHYVTALAPAGDDATARRYDLQPYATLRNLTQGAERGSLFDHRGLVPGSTRGERWFLWPMGVVAPGSMRQWGHQATAFVGRRHFDDARLLERYFELAPATSAARSSAD